MATGPLRIISGNFHQNPLAKEATPAASATAEASHKITPCMNNSKLVSKIILCSFSHYVSENVE
jgi:hypothetical protein